MNHQDREKRMEHTAARRTCVLLRTGLFSLIQETSFEKITLTELCSRSMVPRSTFYRYFEDKYDLLDYFLRDFLERAGLNEDIIYLKNEESMRRVIEEIIRALDARKAEFLKIWQINRDGIFMDIMRNCLIGIMTEQLREADSRGLTSRIPLSIFSCMLVDFYINAARCYLELSDQFSAGQFTEAVVRFADKDFFI